MKETTELCENRRNDLKKIIKERNSRCYQWSWLEVKNCLFVFSLCVSPLKYEVAVRELIAMKNLLPNYSEIFFNSLKGKHLKEYCHYYLLVGKCRYQFSNEKLIEMLRITPSEMRELDSIISDEERQRRENLQIAEESEHRRIESEIEDSIQAYEMNRELKKASNEYKDFTAEEFREYSRVAFGNLFNDNELDKIIFSYKDERFIDDSDM